MTVDPKIVEKAARAIADSQACGYCEGDCGQCVSDATAVLEAVADDLRAEGAVEALHDFTKASVVTQEARIHYSYGVNSGTLTTRNTSEFIRAAIEDAERRTMGRISVDLIETRTVTKHTTPWIHGADAASATPEETP